MRRVAWQYDDRSGWICPEILLLEFFTESDIENARHHCVDSAFSVHMRHHACNGGVLDPNLVRRMLRGMVHDVCEARGRWQRRQRRPMDVLGKHSIEDQFARRFVPAHFVLLLLHQLRPRARGPSRIPAGTRWLADESPATN